MDKEKEICMYLKDKHTGQEKAVFSCELERLFSMNGRTIRRLYARIPTGQPALEITIRIGGEAI